MSSMYPTRKKCCVFGGGVSSTGWSTALQLALVCKCWTAGRCLFTASLTVDYWQGWLATGSLYWRIIFHLHSYGTKQLNQWLEHYPLVSTFIHTGTATELLSVSVFLGPFRRWKVACLLIQKALFQDEKPDKDTYLGPLFLFPAHPMVKKQSLFLTPMSFVPVWPPWPVPTRSPVAVATLISD